MNETKSLLAYVFDERFSVVRTRPDVEAAFLRRLRVGHRIFVVVDAPRLKDQRFRRVVISRNFTGWMLAAAIAAPGIDGDDDRLLEFARTQTPDKAAITLKILTAHFARSPLRRAALLRLGECAEEVSSTLSNRANRKLDVEELKLPAGVDEKDLFANYRGLDHFASFGIRFVYLKGADRFVYRGDAYEELLKKFPHSEEAARARDRLATIRKAIEEDK